MKRKLTTILCADVAGYSRLMSREEEATHARLVALFRELLEPAVEARGGNLVKWTGDGLLAEFGSVVEAVRCAIEIQEGAAERNRGYERGQEIAFRIGINLGDVIIEPDDIFGDGVNIAVRLEGLAEPGGIVVSRSVRDHVRDKLPLRFEDIGEQVLKNIARPVRAFRVRTDNSITEKSWKIGGRTLRYGIPALVAALALAIGVEAGLGGLHYLGSLPTRTLAWLRGSPASQGPPAQNAPPLSIVVLPFANLGGDPQQDYFVDGITESLTTDLSRALPGSFVVARGTAFTYRGKQIDPRQVGRDLNVRYLLEGSVIAEGDQVRVNAQLIDSDTGTSLWAERFDKKRQNVLEIQDQIVGRLSRAVGLELVDIEARRSERQRPSKPSAIDYVMRGQAMANRPTSPQTMIAARAVPAGDRG